MTTKRTFQRLTLAMGIAALGIAVPAEARQLSVAAVDAAVTIQGDTVQATFKVEVTNTSDADASGIVVVFADGIEVSMGDVAAKTSATSQAETRTIDRGIPSHNVPVPVTLKYTSGGEPVETAAVLIVRVQ